VNYPNGWQRFIVIDAAIQALAKEESDVRTLVAERAAIIKEIEQTKEQRDLATPKRVVDLEVAESFIEDWW
jgi:cell division protein FtsB